MMIGPK